jgi:hypothetical protein
MPFDVQKLSVLAYANGFTLWHYATADNAAAVDTEGYFNSASDMLRVGDILIANLETGGSAKAGLFLVESNAGGVVDVADMTRIGADNTD